MTRKIWCFLTNIVTKPKQVYQRHFITSKGSKAGYRPDMRKVAIALAEYMLQNGLIISHEAIRRIDIDGLDYRFYFYCLEKQVGLP